MKSSMLAFRCLPLVAVCLCVVVPVVGAQDCPELIGRTGWLGHTADSVAVSDGYAYTTNSSPWNVHGRFSVFAQRQIPIPPYSWLDEVGFLEIGFANDLEVSGEYAYVVVEDRDTHQFDGDLIVIDVSEPTAPLEVNSVPMGGTPESVALSGEHALVATKKAGLRVINVSDPVDLVEVAVFVFPSWPQPMDETYYTSISISGDYAYVTGQGSWIMASFRIVDVSDPNSPTGVGYTEPLQGWRPVDLAVSGGYAYVLTRNLNPYEIALHVIDVRDPAAPIVVGHFDVGTWVSHIAACGRIVYLVRGWGPPIVLDMSDPLEPTEVCVMDDLVEFGEIIGITSSQRRVYTIGEELLVFYDRRCQDREQEMLLPEME